MDKIVEWLIPLLGIGGILAYVFHQKERARKARLKLRAKEIADQTKEMKAEIDRKIGGARETLRRYNEEKAKFNKRFPRDDNSNS